MTSWPALLLLQGRWSNRGWLCSSGPSSLLPTLPGVNKVRISPDALPLDLLSSFPPVPSHPSLPAPHLSPLPCHPSSETPSSCSGFPTHSFHKHFLSQHPSLTVCPVRGFLPVSFTSSSTWSIYGSLAVLLMPNSDFCVLFLLVILHLVPSFSFFHRS